MHPVAVQTAHGRQRAQAAAAVRMATAEGGCSKCGQNSRIRERTGATPKGCETAMAAYLRGFALVELASSLTTLDGQGGRGKAEPLPGLRPIRRRLELTITDQERGQGLRTARLSPKARSLSLHCLDSRHRRYVLTLTGQCRFRASRLDTLRINRLLRRV